MATNLAIDDGLLEEALKVGGHRTKKDTVTEALEEYIQRRKQARILELFGKVDFDPKYDYKRQRRRSWASSSTRRFGRSRFVAVERLQHPKQLSSRALIREGLASIIGPIRQELLSGVSADHQFQVLRESLRPFPDIPIEALDYEEAAALFNRCRSKGVQGSNTDFLICAVAIRYRMPILTTDEDFTHFARVLPIQLHSPRKHTAG
jgi:predicted nucleic acid-binding protein